jgi:shikimate kinase
MTEQRPNIVLVGFMGTGKTAVGTMLAESLNMRFIDMDKVIVEREGRSIPEIFARDGEEHFRTLEKGLTRELASGSDMVIATGGGIVLDQQNIRDFAGNALVVCLHARPETILHRVQSDSNRPLLDGDKSRKIHKILGERRHLYDAIDDRIYTDDLSVQEVVKHITDLYRSRFQL